MNSEKSRDRLVHVLGAMLLLGFMHGIARAEKKSPAGTPAKPNIVFVFSDDHAVGAIGAYGSKVNKTPNIDEIAKQGAVFTSSFCANSLCGPSRACILTGKHSHLNGFLRNGNRFNPTQTTFPPLMKKAGYETAIIGKWHLGTDPVGFDYWEVLPGQGNYYNPALIQMDGTKKHYEGYCTDIVTDLAIDWLDKGRDPDKPFMLMCQHKAPHRNWSPALRHLDMFKEDIPEPETLHDDYSGRSKLLRENEMTIKDHMHWQHDMRFHGKTPYPDHFRDRHRDAEYRRMTDDQKKAWDAHYEPENQAFLAKMKNGELSDTQILSWKYQRYMKNYLGSVAAVDESVGRLMDWLEENGLTEDTVFIYGSDQGFYLGEHGWYDKRWMFEQSLKMPFLIRWPSVVKAGSKPGAMIQNIDYGPTFLEMAGVEVPAEMQGRSMVGILKEADARPKSWRDAIYYAYYENAAEHEVPAHDGVRDSRYKLMHFKRTREWNLFDLEEDPQELKSVHKDESYAGVLNALKKRYYDLRELYAVNSAIIPETRGDEDWWKQRVGAKKKLGAETQHDLVFLGDSITQGWEGNGKSLWEEHFADGKYGKSLNLGFSGDRTEHVIWRLQREGFADLNPKTVVLMIGSNNTGHLMQDPAEVAAGVRKILDLIQEHTPSAKVVLHGVFPRGKTSLDEGRLNNIAINDIIRSYADGEKVIYSDIAHAFLEEDNSIAESVMPDSLHLTEEGYRRWAEELKKVLDEVM